MFVIPDIRADLKENEDYFDVEALPDEEGETVSQFIDLMEQKKQESNIKAKECIDLPKEAENFLEPKFSQLQNKLTLRFKISKDDLKRIALMSYGLVSTDINEGQYEFEIRTQQDGTQELYYYNEFAGEIIENEPRIYKRYFIIAIIKSLVAQEILIEYETNKFTIHPVFFKKVIASNKAVADQLVKTGFKILTDEEYKKLRLTQSGES